MQAGVKSATFNTMHNTTYYIMNVMCKLHVAIQVVSLLLELVATTVPNVYVR